MISLYLTEGTNSVPSSTDAGIFNIYVYVPGSVNYSEIVAKMSVSIGKAENLFELETSQELVYDGQELKLVEVILNVNSSPNVPHVRTLHQLLLYININLALSSSVGLF